MIVRRRAVLLGMASAGALAALPGGALALGRTPLGGRVSMRLPWPTSGIDPHDLRDPMGAIFGAAIADPVFGLDAAGAPYPALAQAMPTREGADTVVRLREGLRSARGVALGGKDLVASVERARARGAAAVLAEVPTAQPHRSDPTAASFRGIDPGRLARALASPLVALLPRKFDPASPDATGAFRAEPGGSKLTLTRNLAAARGHAFLEGIDVERAADLTGSMRAFETGRDDVGWLGGGLFGERKGSVRFDMGRAGWIVLATGADAQAFGQPGVAQRLCDAMPPERLAHLGLGALPRAVGEAEWGGPQSDLIVDESCVHLVEVARAVAAILGRPDHELTVTPVSRSELARRRAKGKAAIAIDLVRPVGSGPLGALLGLATIDDPARARDIARHPPKLAPSATPRSVTSTLRVGVIGELRVAGAVVSGVSLARGPGGDSWDLGASFRRPAK